MHKPDRLMDFPVVERFWEGGEFRFMGSGIYYKKILFIGVKVCSTADVAPHAKCQPRT